MALRRSGVRSPSAPPSKACNPLHQPIFEMLRERGLAMAPTHFLDGYATGISLVASTKGVTLLPAYVKALLPASLISRPLVGNGPVIEIAAGYRPDNPSPILAVFLRNIDRLVAERTAELSEV